MEIAKWSELKENFEFDEITLSEQDEIVKAWSCTKSQQIEIDPLDIMNQIRKTGPVPVTLINTRDCFAYDLKYTEEVLNLGPGREKVIKKEYYFDPSIEGGFPPNFKHTLGFNNSTDMKDINNLKVGVTCYENFYSHEEMNAMESNIENTEQESIRDEFLPMTA